MSIGKLLVCSAHGVWWSFTYVNLRAEIWRHCYLNGITPAVLWWFSGMKRKALWNHQLAALLIRQFQNLRKCSKWKMESLPRKSGKNGRFQIMIMEIYPRSLPDQTWVQCDEPTCLKWRKLTDGIDPDSLPEKWYCSMNPDLNFKSCDVPEEREQEKTITPYAKVQKRRLWVHTARMSAI